jgi:phenylacetate-CoA ligase
MNGDPSVSISPLDPWIARRLGVERLTRADVEAWQLDRLREVISWARERSPFYRCLYADVPEGAPAGPDGAAALPFLENNAVRDHGPELVCVSLGDISRVVTMPTSGSTGAPKRLYFTPEDLELTSDHFRHGMRALMEPGQRLVVLMPGRTPGSVGALLEQGLALDGIPVHSHGFVDDCEAAAAGIIGFGADALVGVPGQVVRLARSAAGRRIGRGRIKSVLLSGDHVTTAMRAAIERTWDCKVFEHYGSTEVGLGGAVQCRAHAGLHVREADLLFEVIDPATGQTLSDGADGELVVTTLTRRGMPLIRFRTGDLVRMAVEPCPCGSVLRSIETVIGRMSERVGLANGGQLSIADLDEAVYAVDAVQSFVASLEPGDEGDRLTIKAELRAGEPATVLEAALAQMVSRVEALPPVRSAGLDVRAEASTEPRDVAPSAKQRIVDLRGA